MDGQGKKRIPGTVGGDISEDRKGDPSRVSPAQPDLYVDDDDDEQELRADDRESLDDGVEEEPWTQK